MDKLTILLVEDTEVHRQAAIEQLKDHNLIICKSFTEFQEAANKIQGFDDYQKLLQKPTDELHKYEKFIIDGYKDFSFNGRLDVVLTDCLMPAEASAYVPQEGHSTDQVPFGTVVLLWAIQNNIKKAGMLMLNNHHDHPIAAGLDIIGGYSKDVHKYGDTEILLATGDYYKSDPAGEFYSSELRKTQAHLLKEWGFFLQKLMGEATW